MTKRDIRMMATSVLKRFCALLAVAALAACMTNGYATFYRPIDPIGPVLPVTGEPRVTTATGSAEEAVMKMYGEGYTLIGSAGWLGPAEPSAGAIAQAKKVGAAVVVVSRRYQSTQTGVTPITTPTSTTSYSSGSVGITGSRSGYATGSYSGSTTTYGTETTYIPYSFDRYDYNALFFAPTPLLGPGILFRPLSVAERQQAGTNQAMLISGVRNGGPAYQADIIPGDVVVAINGKPTVDSDSMLQAMLGTSGRAIDVVLLRKGARG